MQKEELWLCPNPPWVEKREHEACFLLWIAFQGSSAFPVDFSHGSCKLALALVEPPDVAVISSYITSFFSLSSTQVENVSTRRMAWESNMPIVGTWQGDQGMKALQMLILAGRSWKEKGERRGKHERGQTDGDCNYSRRKEMKSRKENNGCRSTIMLCWIIVIHCCHCYSSKNHTLDLRKSQSYLKYLETA